MDTGHNNQKQANPESSSLVQCSVSRGLSFVEDKAMKFTDLMKELENAPIISGSCAIGWLIKIKVSDKVYKQITLPVGTSYQKAVEIAKR